MIPIYIISLANEQQRREHIAQECQRLSLPFQFIDAYDARHLSQKEIEAKSLLPTHRKAKKQRYLSKGELGCALSHLTAYQTLLNTPHEYALILEDDAYFVRSPTPLLDEAVLNDMQQHTPFDCLILGYVKTLPEYLPFLYRRQPIKKYFKRIFAEQTFEFGIRHGNNTAVVLLPIL